MNKFKCKNFYIIKIRVYASKYLLDKSYNNPSHSLPEQHRERARRYTEFFWEFFNHITGIKSVDWYLKYSFQSKECACDELQEKFGILKSDAECEKIFYIPKENVELFEWIKENVKLPYKVVSVLRNIPLKFLYNDNYGLNTTRREESEEWTKIHIHSLINI